MKKISVAIAVCCALATNYANADVKINGFASIVAGKALKEDKDLYGYNDDISFKNESVFALQLSADLQDSLTATAQIVARGNNDFNAEFEWAYLTYEFTDELQLSAGKMRVPFYKYSDFLDVGYAYRWVRPPQSVYGIPFSTYEGLSLVYNTQIGGWDSTLQGFYGAFNGDIDVYGEDLPSKMNDLSGINWSLSYDWFSTRLAYIVTETSIEFGADSSLVGLENILTSNGLTNIADDLITDEDKTTFLGAGFSIDYNDVLFDAEYTQFEVQDSVLAKQKQYYASLGYRMDSVIVHYTYEFNDDKHDSSRYDQIAAVPQLNAGINQALDAVKSKHIVHSVGARYDFHPAAALKVDFSRLENDLSDDDRNLVSVAVDLVF